MYPYIIWLLFPGMPLAITVMGVLAVDVGTDLIPAMGLGIEPPEAGNHGAPAAAARRETSFDRFHPAHLFRPRDTRDSQLLRDLPTISGWIMGDWRPGLSLLRHAPVT